MKKITYIIALLMIMLFASISFAANTWKPITNPDFGEMGMYTLSMPWTSSGAGSATVATTASEASKFNGMMLIKVIFIPGTGLSDLYDVTITDTYGQDILAGYGADRTNAAAGDAIVPRVGTSLFPYPCTGGLLTGNVTNAGATKTGTIVLVFIQ